jgi:hypothetical protein
MPASEDLAAQQRSTLEGVLDLAQRRGIRAVDRLA